MVKLVKTSRLIFSFYLKIIYEGDNMRIDYKGIEGLFLSKKEEYMLIIAVTLVFIVSYILGGSIGLPFFLK